MIARLRARWACHRSLWCCQYIDWPMCNSWNDPHLLARGRYRLQQPVARVRHALVMAGYWVRPFDMLADRRRWRWQRPTPCGRVQVSELSSEELGVLVAFLREQRDRRDDTGRGGAT